MSFLLTIVLASGALAAEPGVEEDVEKLVIAFNEAYAKNDLVKYFSYYADDVTFWYPSGRSNLTEYKKEWYALIDGGGAVEKNTVSDLQVQVSPAGDAAVASYKVDVETRMPDGKVNKETAQETDVWYKRAGNWKIVHLNYCTKSVE